VSDVDLDLVAARMKLLDDVCWFLNDAGYQGAAQALYDAKARQEMTLGKWQRTELRPPESKPKPQAETTGMIASKVLGITCRLCLDPCRFFILDTDETRWLPG
jgi:hypothetical protein